MIWGRGLFRFPPLNSNVYSDVCINMQNYFSYNRIYILKRFVSLYLLTDTSARCCGDTRHHQTGKNVWKLFSSVLYHDIWTPLGSCYILNTARKLSPIPATELHIYLAVSRPLSVYRWPLRVSNVTLKKICWDYWTSNNENLNIAQNTTSKGKHSVLLSDHITQHSSREREVIINIRVKFLCRNLNI